MLSITSVIWYLVWTAASTFWGSRQLAPDRICPKNAQTVTANDLTACPRMVTYLLTCTCVGIHPGRVEPASPTALTTSRTEALQARRSCASALDTFTQSFLHRAWPKTRGPEIGSRSALIVVAHVFSSSAPRARRCGKEKVLDKLTFGTSCGMSKPAEPSLHEQCRNACKGESASQFHG